MLTPWQVNSPAMWLILAIGDYPAIARVNIPRASMRGRAIGNQPGAYRGAQEAVLQSAIPGEGTLTMQGGNWRPATARNAGRPAGPAEPALVLSQ